MSSLFQVNRQKPEATEHLRNRSVLDHRQALDLVFNKFGPESPNAGYIDGMSKIHRMNTMDQQEFRKLIHVFGGQSPEDCGWKLVAQCPASWGGLLFHVNPDFTKDEDEFYKTVAMHPEMQVPEAMA